MGGRALSPEVAAMPYEPRTTSLTDRLASRALDIAVPAVAALATMAIFLMAMH
jgi:hypothetical protein